MVKHKDMQFFIENLKMNRKRTTIFLTFRSRDSNPRFSVIFPPMIVSNKSLNAVDLVHADFCQPKKTQEPRTAFITLFCQGLIKLYRRMLEISRKQTLIAEELECPESS